MKCVFCKFGEEPKLVEMEATDMAYVGGGDGAGYQIPERADFTPDPESEYLGVHVSMSMYEGGQNAGSYDGWSWAVIPETKEETDHLRSVINREPLFRWYGD